VIHEAAMNSDDLYGRYQDLQRYVGWSPQDAERVQSLAGILAPFLPALIDDFYAEIDRHPDARKVITGGGAQVTRLKGTLLAWVRDLLGGPYDAEYVSRRWKVGWRHVEIGLDQVFTNVAMSRLRRGLLAALDQVHLEPLAHALAVRQSLNTLLDLDLAIIEDAYQSEYTSRLQRGERLATIGQVAGGIAHELRNPLNTIKTSVYYLLNARSPVPAKVAEHLQRIERHVVVADGVITALSNFAKLPLPNMRPLEVAACVKDVLDLTPLPDNIQVDVQYPAALPRVLADPDQLRIVVGNLVRNAREAMSEGGRLTITARTVSDVVELDVADTGAGIPPEQLPRIMEPLYSTKARGLGLGLAIARSILEKNRGSLRVASEPRRGTTFTVRLTAALPEGGRS
jgi:signal transduction histidine kinase